MSKSPKLSRTETIGKLRLLDDDELSGLLVNIGKNPEKNEMGPNTLVKLARQKILDDGERVGGEHWFDTKNPTFENRAPRTLLDTHEQQRVVDHIEGMIEGEQKPAMQVLMKAPHIILKAERTQAAVAIESDASL